MSENEKCPDCQTVTEIRLLPNRPGGVPKEPVDFEVESGEVHDIVRCLRRQLAASQALCKIYEDAVRAERDAEALRVLLAKVARIRRGKYAEIINHKLKGSGR